MSKTDKTIENTRNRPEVPAAFVNAAISRLQKKLAFRLNQKGQGTLTSRHEILGMITEEYDELISAVREKGLEAVQEELLDIAVACVFGDASILANTVDW